MHPGVSVKQPDYKTLSLSTKGLKASVIASSGLRPSSHVDVLVAGSLAIDLCCDYTPGLATQRSEVPQASTSNPALISQSLGGVGANLATAIHYLGASVRLCSAVADDLAGHTALEMLHQRGWKRQVSRSLAHAYGLLNMSRSMTPTRIWSWPWQI